MVLRAMAAPERILLLGEDWRTYGDVALETSRDLRLACALSVGSDASSPSRKFKGRAEYPNEDGLLALSDGERCLVAVADAHFGHEASHVILRGLAARCRGIPDSAEVLGRLLEACAVAGSEGRHDSETTLLVAVLDRAARRGFGISFGDSTLALVDGKSVQILTEKNHHFVTPFDPASFDAERRQTVRFRTRPGQLLCAFTDGIDECHYGSPETSIRPAHMTRLCTAVHADPRSWAERLVALALAGADGHPGGQDNIALAVVAT